MPKPANARAEGETEMIGAITVKCRGPRARGADDTLTLGTGAVTKLEITVTLNTDITNARDTKDMIANQTDAPGYGEGNVMLTAVTLGPDQEPTTTSVLDDGSNNGGLSLTGDVSDDLRKVTWKHTHSPWTILPMTLLRFEFNLVRLYSSWAGRATVLSLAMATVFSWSSRACGRTLRVSATAARSRRR